MINEVSKNIFNKYVCSNEETIEEFSTKIFEENEFKNDFKKIIVTSTEMTFTEEHTNRINNIIENLSETNDWKYCYLNNTDFSNDNIVFKYNNPTEHIFRIKNSKNNIIVIVNNSTNNNKIASYPPLFGEAKISSDFLMVKSSIHQIWIGPKDEPVEWTNTIRELAETSGYSYKIWRNEDMDELFKGYNELKLLWSFESTWNGKSDIMRYLILFKYGGIYIDADTVYIKQSNGKRLNFNKIIKNSNNIFACQEPNSDLIVAGIYGSVKKNKMLLDMMNHIIGLARNTSGNLRIRNYNNLRKKEGPSSLLGPKLFSKYAKKNKVYLAPTKLFYPVPWHGIKDREIHKKMDLDGSMFFQYGYSTNSL